MASEWQIDSLGRLVDIKHGFAFKGGFIHDEPFGDVLLTPGNFAIGGGFKGDRFKYYDGPVSKEFVLEEGDLVVTMTDLSKEADTLGYPGFVPARRDGRRGKAEAWPSPHRKFRYGTTDGCAEPRRVPTVPVSRWPWTW